MPLRVIAGKAKGRKLKMVPGDSTRPVMDRVKEAFFSIIQFGIPNSRFLDLFAGTGSIGIEALSRGAKEVVFIDLERKAIQTIHENLRITKLEKNAIVRQVDAFAYLKHPPNEPFDYIYIAPPQYQDLWQHVLLAIDKDTRWLGDQTEVIVQIDPREEWDVELTLENLEEIDRRKYGKTSLIFFALKEELTTS